MRFSAAIQPHPLLLRTPAAADLLRRLLASKPSDKPEAASTARLEELPADLDQRVRLVGEW